LQIFGQYESGSRQVWHPIGNDKYEDVNRFGIFYDGLEMD
jgi:hypothetical protein